MLILFYFKGVSYEIIDIEKYVKDQKSVEQLSALRNRCANQLTDSMELFSKVEALHSSIFELTNDLNIADLTLSKLENESHKDRHTSETAMCETYNVSLV